MAFKDIIGKVANVATGGMAGLAKQGLSKLGVNLPFKKGGRIKKGNKGRDQFTQQYD